MGTVMRALPNSRLTGQLLPSLLPNQFSVIQVETQKEQWRDCWRDPDHARPCKKGIDTNIKWQKSAIKRS